MMRDDHGRPSRNLTAFKLTRGLEPLGGCSRRLFADLRRIASLLLLKLQKQLSSERLALLATRPKYSVRNLLGVRGGAEERTGTALYGFEDRTAGPNDEIAANRKRSMHEVLHQHHHHDGECCTNHEKRRHREQTDG